MICPNCGEDNSENFRFCGMCGTPLEARRPAGKPQVAGLPDALRADAISTKPSRADTVPAVTASSSFAGSSSAPAQRPEVFAPSPDVLREKSFSGLDSFFEPEEPKSRVRRIFLLLVLLVALGAAGWWTYSNYLAATMGRSPQTTDSSPTSSDTSGANATPAPKAAASAPLEAASSPSPASPATEPPTQSKTPSAPLAAAETAVKNEPSAAQINEAKPIVPKESVHTARIDRKAEVPVANPAPIMPDTGDAEFRKGEAYLYGRGLPENCEQAVKYLKAASAKQNAKARSTFGTMYATGHCAPRDLPTSYSWFAQALRADPNNQILEKDLTAVWNQMTPPERQIAEKLKP